MSTNERLDRQRLARPGPAAPAEVVAWFGAMQAQDYLAALWALGLRAPGSTEATIEAALADGSVIRTHLFRGTWQYVAPADVRWMLALVGARVIASARSRHRQLGLDARTLTRSCDVLARALDTPRTRAELAAALAAARISTAAERLSHILGFAELSGVICGGGRRGKQTTFARLDDRAPAASTKPREEALAELATRYLQSRGPATVRDLAWWTGLPAADAREAFALAKVPPRRRKAARGAHLLPAFDEYLVGYADRSAMIDPAHARRVNAGGGMLQPVVIVDGIVVGTWRRTLGPREVAIDVDLFAKVDRAAVRDAASRYARFLGLAARLST